MEQKTKISAEDGKQELVITREFDLPVELLFKAYAEPEIVEQWMGTKVLKLENNGTIHEFATNEKIIRTFEMENTPFPVQLEFLEFIKLTDDTSKLNMHIIYKSVADRDNILKLPFAYGINMAHNRLQETAIKLK
jgi:uncharacterized protein YndB with AHSA1/START domain